MRGCGLDASGSGCGPVAGCCVHGYEHLESIKRGFSTRTLLHGGSYMT